MNEKMRDELPERTEMSKSHISSAEESKKEFEATVTLLSDRIARLKREYNL